MSRVVVGLLFAIVAAFGQAAPVKPVVPCNRPILVFGDAGVLGKGARIPEAGGFVARMRSFVERVCGGSVRLETVARDSVTLVEQLGAISERLARSPRSIVFLHFPLTDVEAGVPVDRILSAYQKLLDACTSGGSICIIGGQQPVNAFTDSETRRQIEVEQRASDKFGAAYLPMFRHFQSESGRRRLMVRLDSGDGRLLEDYGHELLFELYRRRLLELTASHP